MILIDLSQTLFSVILQNHKSGLNKDLARSMVFMTLLSYRKQFGAEFGAPVLAIDSKTGYWRKEIFEHYKANRKKNREKSDIDWKVFFDIVNTITTEIEECIPWKCIHIDKAEADDIIAVLAMEYGDFPTLIISSDKDYKQLHFKKGVRQYSPFTKKWITTSDPKKELIELILTGDASDGIPNIRSDIDSFVTGKHRNRITQKFKDEFHSNPARIYHEYKERFDLNEKLIDFTKIPEYIRIAILNEFKKKPTGSINKLYRLFVTCKMSRMLSDIEFFKVKDDDYAICTKNSLFK